MNKTRVAVLMGGKSHEHDVSLSSGKGVLKNLPKDKYVGTAAIIGTDGLCKIGDSQPQPIWQAVGVLKDNFDVAFLALHGPNGEDGTVQALLQLAGIPYTASDPYASSLAMNKPRTKDVYSANGLYTPPFVEILAREDHSTQQDKAKHFLQEHGLPIVAKTTQLGSSVGIEIVHREEDLALAIERCLKFSGQVMLEAFISGTEVTAPVLENPYTNELLPLPIIEIRPTHSKWFDFEAKYNLGGAEEICPAPIPQHLFSQCQEIGLKAHLILGCRGMSRTDVIIDDQEICWVIETNTIPGFTETSLLPQAAAAAGIPYAGVVDFLIEEALRRRTPSADDVSNAPRTKNPS